MNNTTSTEQVSARELSYDDTTAQSGHPSRARLALRIGVTGHRPDKLPSESVGRIKRDVHKLLASLHNFVEKLHNGTARPYYSDELPLLRVVSPVAEGTDRMVAQVGLDLGYALQCPLPFDRMEYEKDFHTIESCSDYHSLLDRATGVLELDGLRDPPLSERTAKTETTADTSAKPPAHKRSEAEAYLAAGRLMLGQSDVLIAVWNGIDSGKIGGTWQIIEEARKLNIPTVWIHTSEDEPVRVRVSQRSFEPCELDPEALPESLEGILLHILLPPARPPNQSFFNFKHWLSSLRRFWNGRKMPGERMLDLRSEYFEEHQPAWTRAIFWQWFRDCIGDFRPRLPRLKVGNFVDSARAEWERSGKAILTHSRDR